MVKVMGAPAQIVFDGASEKILTAAATVGFTKTSTGPVVKLALAQEPSKFVTTQ